MSRLSTLPRVMVAPNGARRTKADHPALPVTIPETVETAAACFAAGAGALHAHVRDADGRHSLDTGLYRELLAEMARAVPDMAVQLTTESAGVYGPAAQRAVAEELTPDGISAALREMLAEGETPEALRFYHDLAERDVAVQHILYDPGDAERLAAFAPKLPEGPLQVIFVLGRYAELDETAPAAIRPFLEALEGHDLDWAVCAFGRHETAALAEALRLRGKARVGFENNLTDPEGRPARDNAERVRAIAALPGAA